MRMIGTQGEARRLGLALAVMAAFATGDAGAQTPLPKPAAEPAAAGAVASGPAETTATYGNWVLHCARSKPAEGSGAEAATSCEIVQTIQVEGQREPFAKLAFDVNDSTAFLIPFAFYISYFVLALPASAILRRTGMKKGMALGLAVMAVGAAMWWTNREVAAK